MMTTTNHQTTGAEAGNPREPRTSAGNPRRREKRGTFFADCNGILCVAYADSLWSEPVLVRHYWPTGERSRDWPELLGKRATDGGASQGRYWSADREPFSAYPVFALIDGARTAPIRTETEPIPRPPARGKELRYRDGRWQRLLKKGWVPC